MAERLAAKKSVVGRGGVGVGGRLPGPGAGGRGACGAQRPQPQPCTARRPPPSSPPPGSPRTRQLAGRVHVAGQAQADAHDGRHRAGMAAARSRVHTAPRGVRCGARRRNAAGRLAADLPPVSRYHYDGRSLMRFPGPGWEPAGSASGPRAVLVWPVSQSVGRLGPSAVRWDATRGYVFVNATTGAQGAERALAGPGYAGGQVSVAAGCGATLPRGAHKRGTRRGVSEWRPLDVVINVRRKGWK